MAGAVALVLFPTAAADAPGPWQWMFQDTATSTAQAMQDLHHDVMFFVSTVAVLVLYLVAQVGESLIPRRFLLPSHSSHSSRLSVQFVTKFHYSKAGPIAEKFTHHTTLEVLWTIFPTIIVLCIGIPSLTLIYSMDQHNDRPGERIRRHFSVFFPVFSFLFCLLFA
jgi:cytochrome c oxidase subunit 2